MAYSPLNFSSRGYSTFGNYNYHQNNVMNMTKNVCDLISNLSGTKLMSSHTTMSSPVVGGSKMVSCEAFPGISFSDVVRGVMGTKSTRETTKPPNEINNLLGIVGQFVQIFDVPNMMEPARKSNVPPTEGVPLIKSTIEVVQQTNHPDIECGQTHILFNSSLNDSQLASGATKLRRSYAEVTKEKPLFPRRFQSPLNNRTMPQSVPVSCYLKPSTPPTTPSTVDESRDGLDVELKKTVCPLRVSLEESSPTVSSEGLVAEPVCDLGNERLHSNSLSSESDASDSILEIGRRRPKRTLSECSVDSDDSFIVFEEDEGERDEDEWSDGDSSSDESDCENNNDLLPSPLEEDGCNDCSEKAVICKLCSEDEPQDEVPELNLAEINERWNSYYPDKNCVKQSSPKVKFVEGKKLAVVRPLVTWSYAHRRARIGHWMQVGRDRERFKEKIASIARTLNPVLAPHHRQAVYSQRFDPPPSDAT